MQGYKEIRAVYDENTIRVYQAFGKEIAEEIHRLGHFGEHFKMDRMSWIKPSFLWMMYRCGWAQKENQEYVFAIDMNKQGFCYLVENAVLSSYSKDMGITQPEWKRAIKYSDIRCQWDSEKDIYGNALSYRTIQLGLRRDALFQYVNKWIVRTEDITDFVKMLYKKRIAGEDLTVLLPDEKVFSFDKSLSSHPQEYSH